MKTLFFSILGSIFLHVTAIGQAQSDLEKTYLSNIPFHQEVISGGYYVDPPPNIEGNPYFRTKSFENGTITINGLTYESVPLLYNIQKDQIITFHPVHSQKILLNSEKINAFTLFTPEKFVFVQIENNTYPQHNNGFYELVIDGKAQLLCKHYKTRSTKKEVGKYSGYFTENSDYLLKKNDQVIVIKKRKQAFEFLGLDKKTVLKELKKNQIYFRGNKRSFLQFITEIHNQQLP